MSSQEHDEDRRPVARFFHDNGLSIALLLLTMLSLAGHLIAGRQALEQEDPSSRLTLWQYACSPHFLGSLFENWESEFLQMAAYVVLTIRLFQRGSSESKDPDGGEEEVDEDPRDHAGDRDAPWPVRRGGIALRIYNWSLTIALLALFVASFLLHAHSSADKMREEGEHLSSWLDVLGKSEFWFESFQNWQSEFLSVGVLVVLSIFLRQKGSPESKPVHHPHRETGGG
jgi:hypothetical protein